MPKPQRSVVDARLALAVAGDEAYAPGIAVALHSALSLLTDEPQVDVVLLDGGLCASTVLRLERVARRSPRTASFRVIRDDNLELANLPDLAHFGQSTYLRLLLPQALPLHSLVLYVDSDTLTRRSLAFPRSLLFESSAPVAGVADETWPTIAQGLSQTHRVLGLDPAASYLNAGVLLMNLEQWRVEDLSASAIAYLHEFGSTVRFADQDAINARTAGRAAVLAGRYNVQIQPVLSARCAGERATNTALEARVDDATILHFVGAKPWQVAGLTADRRAMRATADWTLCLWRTGFVEASEWPRVAGRFALALLRRVAIKLGISSEDPAAIMRESLFRSGPPEQRR